MTTGRRIVGAELLQKRRWLRKIQAVPRESRDSGRTGILPVSDCGITGILPVF